MYKLIIDIADRCYAAAEQRGKDVSCLGCLQALQIEFTEYWAAIDAEQYIDSPDAVIRTAASLSGADFADYYNKHIHNSDMDELADVLIVAATWARSAAIAAGTAFNPERSTDVMLASGAIQFVCGRVTGSAYLEKLRAVVNLKMSYNETRSI